jgi:hypothetical protein
MALVTNSREHSTSEVTPERIIKAYRSGFTTRVVLPLVAGLAGAYGVGQAMEKNNVAETVAGVAGMAIAVKMIDYERRSAYERAMLDYTQHRRFTRID